MAEPSLEEVLAKEIVDFLRKTIADECAKTFRSFTARIEELERRQEARLGVTEYLQDEARRAGRH